MVVDARLVFTWLGLSSFIILGGSLICGTGTPDGSGKLVDAIVRFIGFDLAGTECAGAGIILTLLVSIVVYLPGLFILASLAIPVLQGILANPFVGTLTAIAGVAALIALVATWLIT